MTPAQAAIIFKDLEIAAVLASEEERELLRKHNPELLEAYEALERYAQASCQPNAEGDTGAERP